MCDDAETRRRLDRIEKCVDQNNRALRGHNSEDGLVGQVTELRLVLDSVKTLFAKDMTHIKEIIEQRDKYEHEGLLSWAYLRDKALMPFTISIFTAVVTAFLILKFGL